MFCCSRSAAPVLMLALALTLTLDAVAAGDEALPVAPPVACPDTEGATWSLEDHRGRNVVLVFHLGGTCAHCMQQLQLFGAYQEVFERLGTTLAAVGSDDLESATQLKHNAAGIRFPMSLLADPQHAHFRAYEAFDAEAGRPLHATVLIDAEGRVRWKRVGLEPFLDVPFLLDQIVETTRAVGRPALSENVREALRPSAALAPRLSGLGPLHVPVTTKVEGAQEFFDQGMRLIYGFNHFEALRSFQEVARLDPDCAMAYWGQALALGPNLNDPLPPASREQDADRAIRKAVELAGQGGLSEREGALIEALATRHAADGADRRGALNVAYADASRAVAARFPDDPDVLTLCADAVMNTSPWNYWSGDGRPRAFTAEVVAMLEDVIRRWPDHAGAHHLYMHAVEASSAPERGLPSADRLGAIAPGAGHLVHMPSHIYIRVGQYLDAIEVNRRAVEADDTYLAASHAQGLYPLGYAGHNIHFLYAAALWAGQSEVALTAADDLVARGRIHGSIEHFDTSPLWARIRFGRWDEILTRPAPPEGQPYHRGVWHYARGLAYVANSQDDRAERELSRLDAIAAQPELETVSSFVVPTTYDNSVGAVLDIVAVVLRGELAASRGDFDAAIAHLDRAVRLQSNLAYTEPENLIIPVRQYLGAALLRAGRADEAAAVYWDDLRAHPENGWSLLGLSQALEAQGKAEEAQALRARYEHAWRAADHRPTDSRW